MGIGARCAASAPCSNGNLFQRVFLIIPTLTYPVLPINSLTTSLKPVEGQSNVENISKGQARSATVTLFRNTEVQREGL